MEKTYKNVSYFVMAILAVVIWGFFRTYFGLFPAFKGIGNVQHFHGLMMLLWFALLISQPLLISYNKPELHRAIGKSSYVLVPLILLSIFLVARMGYLRNAATFPHPVNVGGLALNIPAIFGFAAIYLLAMTNKKNTAYHMRYMIATAVLLIGPGVGRAAIIYGGMPFPKGVEVALIVTDALCAGLLLFDIIKRRPYKPYLISFLIFIALHLCWEFQMAAWWQAFGGKFADLFF